MPRPPELIASSIGTTSVLRTSPTTTRVDSIRSVCGYMSAIVIRPVCEPSLPTSPLEARSSIAITCAATSGSSSRKSSRSVSSVTMRSPAPTLRTSARSSEVLPTPMSPAISIVCFAATRPCRNALSAGLSVPHSTRSSREALMTRWRRIAMVGRVVSSVAATRERSGSRKLVMGVAGFRTRSPCPERAASRLMRATRLSSSSATGSTRWVGRSK